jgi:predicted PhzF superfamily epimerase YddE/YHI9
MTRAYTVADVFTSTPLLGNPVAVVLDTEGLDGQVRITVRPDGEVGVGGSAVTVATGVLNV